MNWNFELAKLDLPKHHSALAQCIRCIVSKWLRIFPNPQSTVPPAPAVETAALSCFPLPPGSRRRGIGSSSPLFCRDRPVCTTFPVPGRPANPFLRRGCASAAAASPAPPCSSSPYSSSGERRPVLVNSTARGPSSMFLRVRGPSLYWPI